MGNVQVRQDKAIKETKTMGQTCSKKDSSLQNYEENSYLKTATAKVGAETLNILPKSRVDPDWEELRQAKGLDLLELLALKHYACSGVSRGKLPGNIVDDELYKFVDTRVKCDFTISLFDGSVVMPANLMIASGAMCEIRLPGRKVVQLGLQQAGEAVRTKGSTPGRGENLKFFPSVWVSATFVREGPNGETIKDEVKELLQVSAGRSDYENALHSHGYAEEAEFQNVQRTPETSSPPWLQKDTKSTPTTPAAQAHIEPVKLSPVRHRPVDRPDEQAFLGIEGLRKLRMHVNAEKGQLEIEEETYIET